MRGRTGWLTLVAAILAAFGMTISACTPTASVPSDGGAPEANTPAAPAENQSDARANGSDDADDASDYAGIRDESGTDDDNWSGDDGNRDDGNRGDDAADDRGDDGRDDARDDAAGGGVVGDDDYGGDDLDDGPEYDDGGFDGDD
jgi:hypothetical protein